MSISSHFPGRAPVAALLLSASLAANAADWSPAGDLEGTPVETRDGQRLGQVHDFAIDLDSGRIHYVVVSIGSFLVDDSLIAVHPDALRRSADAEPVLVLERDAAALRNARRFTDANWPDEADVTAEPSAARTDTAAEGAEQPAGGRGTATISSDSKTATLAAGERRIEVNDAPPQASATSASRQAGADQAPPDSPFARLDEDGNGLLDRSEIAHQMGRDDRYADIDTDGDGAVDPQEFAALMRRRGAAGE